MKPQRIRNGIWGLMLAIAMVFAINPIATPATFGEKEVDQKKFIAIALPLQADAYKLLILEQISNSKKCWRVTGKNPTQVELLLLKFNFTGICGRSLDSNGYSIRLSGQDLALDYMLILKRRKKGLVLLGLPRVGQTGKTLEIARTQGLNRKSPTQLILDPNWRFSRRVFKGKPVGHIYLSRK